MFEVHIPLNEIETDVLRKIFDQEIESKHRQNYAEASLISAGVRSGFVAEDVDEALSCLLDRGLLSSPAPGHVNLPLDRFGEVCELFLLDYDERLRKVGTYLLGIKNDDDKGVANIALAIDLPFLIVYHFVDFFRKLGWVRVYREDSEYACIAYVSPLLKRAMGN